ncbi:MAG: hypothetical protein N4J56_002668 [Chroococcidiopsis sp. SAG 2025]|uniref:hypothetical protein n=1 Tax=Chroococcidiopsis sp. SAG 2025 TaxID=171389 RepID=UPI002937213C|nr:hypothetical protein [Chroococcidiopsis sp. SAG 2025]MDV2993014.1 hypothetical protein [Chroococcidiopsis sp. SAG 2025]
MSSLQKTQIAFRPVRRFLWLERLIALVVLLNFFLVLFDLSYIHWHDFYFEKSPQIVQQYDPIKGIEPHRETTRYLAQFQQIRQQIEQTGIQSPEVENLLAQMRQLSDELIEDNPFAIAQKTGHLEKIKNQVRDRVHINSAHQAFDTFWSQAYLNRVGWERELDFFTTNLQPLIETNYYRGINTRGKFIDRFWLIDLPFVAFFGLEILIRTFFISRQRPDLNWLEALLRRWYDLFLLFPFWRWLRVIPVTIRLYQAELLNLEPVRKQIKYDFVTNFAEEMTEIVGVRLIDQMQDSIERGDAAEWLLRSGRYHPYININNTNEVQEIANRLLRLTIYQVIPKVQTDIESLLHYSIENAIRKTQMYQQIQHLPGMETLPRQVSSKLANDISQSTYTTLTNLLEDPVVIEKSSHLIQNFSIALETEVKKQHNLQALKSLFVDLLEEVKINYVKDIAQGGVERSWEEANQLRRIIRQ